MSGGRFTAAQIRWAALHDWFIRAADGVIYVREFYTMPSGNTYQGIEFFTSFRALRDWAGY